MTLQGKSLVTRECHVDCEVAHLVASNGSEEREAVYQAWYYAECDLWGMPISLRELYKTCLTSHIKYRVYTLFAVGNAQYM